MSLTANDLTNAANRLNCSVAIIRAVAKKESAEIGIKNGALVKRFEPAVFKKRTGRSASTYAAAYAINPHEALSSTSWGMFQIMGYNYEAAGYASVEKMVEDYLKGEDRQLNSYVLLILDWGLDDELRGLKYDSYAYRYNGPNYKVNNYAVDLEKYYRQFARDPLAGLEKKKMMPVPK